MPQTLTVGAFVLGAILILIAVLGGRFKIFGAEIRGSVGRGARIIAAFVGLLILVGLFLTQFHELPSLFSTKVIATNPENGATDVAPSLSEIAVTFSKPMIDNRWSWVQENADSYPKTIGQPYYINEKTCVLPVQLRPGKSYVIWINTEEFKNFVDKKGNPVKPYRLAFTTRQK